MISYVLDLPFGRGKKYLSNVSGFADKIISGWGMDGTTYLQTGFPLKFNEANGNSALSFGLGHRNAEAQRHCRL